jgi:DNA-binding transcriptional LysR family regulator
MNNHSRNESKMDIDELKMFCAVVQLGSISAAAGSLGRVPSNLTTRIKNLEHKLGEELFVRQRQRLYLSEAGKKFLPYARKILDLTDEAKIRISQKTMAGDLRIGAMEAAAASRLPHLLATFHRHWPDVTLSLHTNSTKALIGQLRDGALDVIFADLLKPELEGSVIDLGARVAFDEELMIVVPPRLTSIERPSDLGGLPLIVFGAGCSYRQRLTNWFEDYGENLPRFIEMHSYHSIIACVSAGAGVSLVPKSVLSLTISNGVFSVPMPNGRSKTHIIWKRGKLSPPIMALLELFPVDQVGH